MTSPTTPGSLIGASGAPNVPIDPTTGLPKLGVLTGGSTAGQVSIWPNWSMPTGLNPDQKIWFGNEQHSGEAPITPHGMPGQAPYQTMHLESVQKVYHQLAALSLQPNGSTGKNTFLEIQAALNDGNFGTVTPSGIMDPETQSALGKAIQTYLQYKNNGFALSFMDFLQNAATGGGNTSFPSGSGSSSSGGSTSSGTKLPVFRVDDPAYIKEAAQAAFENALGRQATKQELNKFVAQFQQMQKNYELTTNGKTGSSPELTAEALQYAENSNPQEFQQQQHETYLDALVNMFAPSGSNRPSPGTPAPVISGAGTAGSGQGAAQ